MPSKKVAAYMKKCKRAKSSSKKSVTRSELYKAIASNSEVKYLIPSQASTEDVAVTNSWVQAVPETLPSRTAVSGKFIKCLRLLMTGRLESADSAGNAVRILIVKSMVPGATTGSAMLPAQTGATTLLPYSPWGSKKRASLRVLYDKVHLVQADDAHKVFRISLKLDYKAVYDTTNSRPSYGDIQIYYCSDSSATPHPTISFATQLSYLDD